MIRALDPDLEKDFQLFEDSSIKFRASKNLNCNTSSENDSPRPCSSKRPALNRILDGRSTFTNHNKMETKVKPESR